MSRYADLKGDRDLLKQLRKIHDEAPKETQIALREWSRDTRDLAQEEAPVDVGTLRAALSGRIRKLNAEVGLWGQNLKKAYYARFVHDGTSKMQATPFLVRAFRKNQDLRPYLRRLVERLTK
ncbi:phage protein, HK97 gp10 family [Saccharopolyspora kobensis]|uniref:Phage protein, HK97 gp10 family n=1 Tax=Saccharopolyspora kobensis TaxID=146035 RepID=A0A1H6ELT7_9PSEU|nr:HK97-gp10 family putative phage morphogenesis protein [Saccharopolyspora kobensis]SEG98827.1 phage protein, HK97 gp10 family [Saccharopolyspora kobensis]SFD23091.1 phage protein, HK97 gp10 family [Saccharopolyspora kobensis]